MFVSNTTVTKVTLTKTNTELDYIRNYTFKLRYQLQYGGTSNTDFLAATVELERCLGKHHIYGGVQAAPGGGQAASE